MKHLKHFALSLVLMALLPAFSARAGEHYQLKIYHLKTEAQVARVDSFLSMAWLPALHRAGIAQVGVFKPIVQDTADLRVYVLIPLRSLEQLEKLENQLRRDAAFQSAGSAYLQAPFDNTPYARLETILLKSFRDAPKMIAPALKGPRDARVYELRSYEGPTEKYFENKVKMFNDGDEIGIFRKLGFNAVFYGEVVAGSRMPNLMYMTAFNSQEDRDAHWKAFSADPDWKKLSAMQEYKNNVSRNDKFFLRPTAYSDF
ncbi:NIPSNAP family protein [Chitinophaga lutea]